MKPISNSNTPACLLAATLVLSLGGCQEVDQLFANTSDEVARIDISHQDGPYNPSPVESEAAAAPRYASPGGGGGVQGISLHRAPAPRAEREPRGQHSDFGENARVDALQESTSTFSVDVNTASYTMMRNALDSGRMPAPNSVRPEEFINYFDYDYPAPEDMPFSINMEAAPSFFGSDDSGQRHLMQIGIRARDVSIEDMKPTNIVFLVDVSGSMRPEQKLPLAKQSLHILLEQLRPTDTVAIQTYASGSRTILEPTPVSNYTTIERAIQRLEAHGATNGEGGIRDAYSLAERAFVEDGNNRVVIMTDGDFNVGKRGDDIVEMVKNYRQREIALTAVAFGRGGHNDAVMERLAREGSGNYFYIDNVDEAHRIFGIELPSTVEIIASDVRIQVEFQQDAVRDYRLVGYEKRVLDNADFKNEATNAAEVGPGHTVTAFYEVELYDHALQNMSSLADVRVRYKERLLGSSLQVNDEMLTTQIHDRFENASPRFRFATAVAEFAGLLRNSEHSQNTRFDEIRTVASNARFSDFREHDEFLELVGKAENITYRRR